MLLLLLLVVLLLPETVQLYPFLQRVVVCKVFSTLVTPPPPAAEFRRKREAETQRRFWQPYGRVEEGGDEVALAGVLRGAVVVDAALFKSPRDSETQSKSGHPYGRDEDIVPVVILVDVVVVEESAFEAIGFGRAVVVEDALFRSAKDSETQSKSGHP